MIIDGLDQLEASENLAPFAWLPQALPANVRILASVAPGPVADYLRRRQWQTFDMPALTAEVKREIAVAFLADYRKELSEEALALIAGSRAARSPLYLAAVLNEIRLHGSHETLSRRLGELLSNEDVPTLADSILNRWEHDFNGDRSGLVSDTMTLLALTPTGLSETELLELLGSEDDPLPRVLLTALLLAASPAIIEGRGRLLLARNAFRTAIERRYLSVPGVTESAAARLAQLFKEKNFGLTRDGEGKGWGSDIIAFLEALWTSGDHGSLREHLVNPIVLVTACKADQATVAGLWDKLESSGFARIKDSYEAVIANPESSCAAAEVAVLLRRSGHLQDAAQIERRLVEFYRRPDSALTQFVLSDKVSDPRLSTLVHLLLQRATGQDALGDASGAAASLQEAAGILTAAGELERLAEVTVRQAVLAQQQGKIPAAIDYYDSTFRIARQSGSVKLMVTGASGAARILAQGGDGQGALARMKAALAACDDKDDPLWLGLLCNDLGVLQSMLGDPESKIRSYRMSEEHLRRAGDEGRETLAKVVANQAEYLEAAGQVEEAISRYRESYRIFRLTGSLTFERFALKSLLKLLAPKVAEGAMNWTEWESGADELILGYKRMLELEAEPSEQELTQLNLAVYYVFRARERVRQSRMEEAADDYVSARGIAEAIGDHELLIDIEAGLAELGQSSTGQATGLCCVHCGQQGDASMSDQENHFVARAMGKTFRFAQCARCREALKETGHFALRSVIGTYPLEQKRRGLVPGSDEI